MAESQRAALSTMDLHNAMDEEFQRVGAPGSSWTDEEREKWEAEMRDASVESAARKLLTVDEAADLAVETVNAPASSPLLGEISKELDALSTPPEHRDQLRDRAVEEWERQHPEHR